MTLVSKSGYAAACLAGLMALAPSARAQTVIDFEGYTQGDFITNDYAAQGVIMSPVQILTAPNYNSTGYPPHSGVDVVEDYYGPTMQFNFSTHVTNAGAWVTDPYGVTETAYDAGGNVLGTNSIAGNYESTTFLDISAPDIASVTFYNKGATSDYMTLDDLTFTPASVVPDGSSLAMLAMGGVPVLFGLKRRMRRA